MKITIDIPNNKLTAFDWRDFFECLATDRNCPASSIEVEDAQVSSEDEDTLREDEEEWENKGHKCSLIINGEKYADWQERREEELREAYNDWEAMKETYASLCNPFHPSPW